jgi:hypothetical protein
MTDAQLLTLAIVIIVPLSLLLYSNSRITYTKDTLRAEIGESKHAFRAEMETVRAEIGESKHTLRAEMETVRAEIGETKHALRAEMETLRAETAAGFVRIERAIERLETKLVIHELEHHK